MKRRALLIGEKNYENPKEVIDVAPRDVSVLMSKLGKVSFECESHIDVKNQELPSVIEDFLIATPCDSINIIYFSGHGFQYKGKNYIVPIDMNSEFAKHKNVDSAAYDINRIFSCICKSIKLIVIIDACRSNVENTYDGKYSEALTPPKDTMIAYATQFNTTAGYNKYNMSYFTSSLCNNILEPNTTIDSLFTKVRAELISLGHLQLSHCVSNLTMDIYLNKIYDIQDVDSKIYDFIEKYGDEYEKKIGVINGEFEVFVDASVYFDIPLLDVYYKYQKVQSQIFDASLLDEKIQKTIDFMIIRSNSLFRYDKYHNWHYRDKVIRMGEIPVLPIDMQEKLPVEGKELLILMNYEYSNHVLKVITNLPDGFYLQLSRNGGYGFVKGVVENGVVEFVDIVEVGKYKLKSPVVNVMKSVDRTVVGEKGRNLLGEFISFNPIGGKTVLYEFEL